MIVSNFYNYYLKEVNNHSEREKSNLDQLTKAEQDEIAKENERKNNIIKSRIKKNFEDAIIVQEDPQQNKLTKSNEFKLNFCR